MDIDMEYVFEPMGEGKYQVRLCGMFVCYSTHTNKHSIDSYLRNEGYKNRQEYFDACLEDVEESY